MITSSASMNSIAPRVEAVDIAHFLAFGFVHLRGWLTADEIATLRAEAEEALLDGKDGEGEVMRARHIALMATTTPFSMSLLVDDPRFLDAATTLLGRPVVPMPAVAVQHTGDTGWHTDRRTALPRTRLSFGHYFEPLTASTGALRFLPATHLLSSYEAFDRYVTEHCSPSSPSVDHIGGQAVETQPGDVIAFDCRVLHASRGGRTRLRWVLEYCIEPETPEKIARHRDSLAEWIYLVDHPGGKRYPLYTDWAANRPQHPDRAAMITRMTQLDLLRIPHHRARFGGDGRAT
jgi:hypothetical protein